MKFINTTLEEVDGRYKVNTETEASEHDLVYMLANILYVIEQHYGNHVILEAVRVHKDKTGKTIEKMESFPVPDLLN